MLCDWGVKAGMVRVWVWKVKLCDLLAMHFPKDMVFPKNYCEANE